MDSRMSPKERGIVQDVRRRTLAALFAVGIDAGSGLGSGAREEQEQQADEERRANYPRDYQGINSDLRRELPMSVQHRQGWT